MKENLEVKQAPRACTNFIIKRYVRTIANSFCATTENQPDRASVLTHKNNYFGAISVKKRGCAATISKVESHITDEVLYHTLAGVVRTLIRTVEEVNK